MEFPDISNNNHSSSATKSGPLKPKKKRIRNWTAEDRAVHREFEKSRREAFSERLMVSGGNANTRRPFYTDIILI